MIGVEETFFNSMYFSQPCIFSMKHYIRIVLHCMSSPKSVGVMAHEE